MGDVNSKHTPAWLTATTTGRHSYSATLLLSAKRYSSIKEKNHTGYTSAEGDKGDGGDGVFESDPATEVTGQIAHGRSQQTDAADRSHETRPAAEIVYND